MRGLVYMASRDKVDVDTFHKGIQYALERLGKSKFGFKSTTVSNFKSKKHEGSGNELVDYSRAPCLGADQKTRGLWERDWLHAKGDDVGESDLPASWKQEDVRLVFKVFSRYFGYFCQMI